jgi:hypothetical protein
MLLRLVLAVCAISASPLSSALAAEPFVGRWAIKPEICTGHGDTAATASLVATDTAVVVRRLLPHRQDV